MEIKDNCYKGTRIVVGNDKREYLNKCIAQLITEGYREISIPIIQNQSIFHAKIGDENSNMLYSFKDRGDRDICLAPEYTAIIQQLSQTYYKYNKDVKLFYIQECFRGEKPQAGRYRQFTQLGIEILNPTKDYITELKSLVVTLLSTIPGVFNINSDVTRGLDYYDNGKGFEVTCDTLGAQKQVCGGGVYKGGVGFALGVDRLMLLKDLINNNAQKDK